jgi:hypothetical protein
LGYRILNLLAAAALLVAAGVYPVRLASLPPTAPPAPVDQGTGTMVDDGSIVMELRT